MIFAFLFGFTAHGIRARKAWAAYGCALFLAAGNLLLVKLWLEQLRAGGGPESLTTLIGSCVITVLLLLCLFLAGRSIQRDGGKLGSPWGWVAAVTLYSLFLLSFRLYTMPTGSMERGLLVGDRILASLNWGQDVSRGDVVIFRYPLDHKQTFIKRVIGVSGDRVRIEHRRVRLNGAFIAEPFVYIASSQDEPYRDTFPSVAKTMLYPPAIEMLNKNVSNGEVVVPPGKLFVLGDNRDESLDSRYWGFVDLEQVIGKAELVYYSVPIPAQTPGKAGGLPPTIFHARWDRLFRIIR